MGTMFAEKLVMAILAICSTASMVDLLCVLTNINNT